MSHAMMAFPSQQISLAFHVKPCLPLITPKPRKCVHRSPYLAATNSRRGRPHSRRGSNTSADNKVRTAPPLSSAERLQKVLSYMGVASRRVAEEMILSRRVRVNGRVVRTLGTLVNPYTDSVAVDGKTVELPQLSWLAVHKPRGILSVTSSAKRSVSDYAPRRQRRGLVAVSPIEEEASGLVILTNDGASADTLSRQGNGFVKEWIVDCKGSVPWSIATACRNGIELSGDIGGAVKADVQLIGSGRVEHDNRNTIMMSRLEVRLRDNRRHVISRMFEKLGYEVLRSSRQSFGPVLLGSLKRGGSRPLIAKEVKALKRGVSGKTVERTQER